MEVQQILSKVWRIFKAEKIQMFQPKEGKDLVLHQLAVVEWNNQMATTQEFFLTPQELVYLGERQSNNTGFPQSPE